MKNNTNAEKKSFDKPKSIIISLIISIILWVAIVNIVNPDVTTKLHNIPIQTNGISALRDKGLVMVNSNKLPTCSVTIRGKRSDIIEFQDRIYAVVNVSDITTVGKITVPVTITSPSSINLEKQSLGSITAEIETRYEKDIPVTIKPSGDSGDILIKTESEKKNIRIYGSKKDLDKIHGCLVTPDISEINSDINVMYSFVYLSKDGEPIQKPETIFSSDTNLLLLHTVYNKMSTKAEFTLPSELKTLFRSDIDENAISEKEVFYGVRSNITPLDKINFTLDVSKISDGENKIALNAEEIEGVYIPENQLVLSFSARKLITKDLQLDINIENLPAEYSASLLSKDTYTLSGTEKELENPEAFIDLKTASVGTHQFPIKFKNNNIQPKHNYFATVVITRKGE